MPSYEYKIVPAPTKGLKAKGVKGPEARFAHTLEDRMNEMAAEGWEYQRAETLPSVERSGLTSTTTEWRNVLVFRRLRDSAAEAFTPELLPAPDAATPETPQNGSAAPAKKDPPVTAVPKPAAADRKEPSVEPAAKADTPAAPSVADNSVENTKSVSTISSSLTKLAEARKLSKSDT
ncbi:DUF4177 domain-containing protein [Sulfitobacter sp. JB4-11]|uniref:DUF4177 domain-containing protein n=1 Tax=Sulfitobacter rhodophyticola TaxID=3238304 RepID=UPI003514CAAB